MSRSSGVSVENSFVKGFLTEFSGFNFPEGACKDTLNCTFSQTGKIERRNGLALESPSTELTISYTPTSNYTSFVWKSAGYRSENSFLVHQIDGTLHFYRISGDSLSDSKTSFTFDLSTHATGTEYASFRCDFSNGSGRLFVSNPDTETFYLKYDPDTESITSKAIEVKVRDFKVLEDGYDIDQNMPFSVTNNPEYVYNIKNQGWTDTLINGWQIQGNSTYPNKGQVWWYFRDATANSIPIYMNFRPDFRYKFQDLGKSLAPRGTFIIDAFNQDRDSVSGLSGLESLTSRGKRPTCNAFINGRLFISGVEADGYNGVVYFTNILKNAEDDIRFYQNGDPSSEVNPQLLSNDGGTFTIPEAGKIIRMIPVKNTLVIFATNGVWTVAGNEGVGFTATDFSIEKISDEPCVNNESYIVVSTFPIWWTNEGIFSLESSSVGAISSVSLSNKTIQTFFNGIPLPCKRYVKVGYNTLSKEVYWMYSSDEISPRLYDRVLVMNVSTQGFYLYSIPTSVTVVDLVSPPVAEVSSTNENVVDSLGATVVNSLSAAVTVEVFEDYNPATIGNCKFVVTYDTDKLGFGKFSNEDLLDWDDILGGSGLSYRSYLVSGPRVRGEGQRKFQENYVNVFSEYKANSSCWVSAQWDYGNNVNSNRWSTPQQAIRQTANFDSFSRRLKIRGQGRAVQFKFESEGEKPFILTGWASFETINDKL